jgi:diaminopimelate decarboxylase
MTTILQKNIIKELGLENLPEERQMKIILGMGRIIQQNVILRVLDELKEEDKDEFDKFLAQKGDDQEAIFNFLQSKIPNLDSIINEEIEKFKKEGIDFIEKVTTK